MLKPHTADGSDQLGNGLPITIRIGPDGLVYFQDITAELLPIVLSLRPDDADLRRRVSLAAGFQQENDA